MVSQGQHDGASAAGTAVQGREQKGLGIRGSDVLAGACVASIAAVAGGYFGALGSVASAFLVSTVSGVTLPILRRPLRTGEDKLRGLAAKKAEGKGDTAAGSAATTGAATPSVGGDADEADASIDVDPAEEGDVAGRRKRRLRVALATTLIAFLAAFAAIFVVQAISGTALSNGTGQLQERVTGNHPEGPATPSISPSAPTETAPTETAPTETAPAEDPTASPSAEESEPSDESTSTPSEPAEQESQPSGEVVPDPAPGSDQAAGSDQADAPAAAVPVPETTP